MQRCKWHDFVVFHDDLLAKKGKMSKLVRAEFETEKSQLKTRDLKAPLVLYKLTVDLLVLSTLTMLFSVRARFCSVSFAPDNTCIAISQVGDRCNNLHAIGRLVFVVFLKCPGYVMKGH